MCAMAIVKLCPLKHIFISVDTVDTGDNYCEPTTVTSKYDFNWSVSYISCVNITTLFLIRFFYIFVEGCGQRICYVLQIPNHSNVIILPSHNNFLYKKQKLKKWKAFMWPKILSGAFTLKSFFMY